LILIDRRRLCATRALLCWAREELSKNPHLALGTTKQMEGFDGRVGAGTDTPRQIAAMLEKAGIEFLNDCKPGVRLKANSAPQVLRRSLDSAGILRRYRYPGKDCDRAGLL